MNGARRVWRGSGHVSLGPMWVFYNLEHNRALDGWFSSWRVFGVRRGRFAASWRV